MVDERRGAWQQIRIWHCPSRASGGVASTVHRRVRGEAAQASPDAGGVRTLSHLCGDVRVFKPGASACGPVLGLARRRRVCPQSSRHAHASRLAGVGNS